MQTRIETSRLILRPFQLSDAQASFEWFGDPVVMRFTPTGPDKSIEETITRIAGYQNHQKARGFSKWLIQERNSGVAIGDSGLFVLPEYGWIDLGFRFAQPSWKGLATEVAPAWVRAALDEFRVGQLGAFAHSENLASVRVLEKVGFREKRRAMVMGMDSIVFSLGVSARGRVGLERKSAPHHPNAGVAGKALMLQSA
jgi:RimJ/RimL family protein N-acetyltransferase